MKKKRSYPRLGHQRHGRQIARLPIRRTATNPPTEALSACFLAVSKTEFDQGFSLAVLKLGGWSCASWPGVLPDLEFRGLGLGFRV